MFFGRRWALALLLCGAGCRTDRACVPCSVEQHVGAVAAQRVEPEVVPVSAEFAAVSEQFSLPELWQLALVHNPALREAAAEIEAARGRFIQSGLYLNPEVTYQETGLGDTRDARGTLQLQLRQEIITAGKLRLDMEIAARSQDIAFLGMVNRKFDVLTRVRRAYYDYLTLDYTARVSDEVVASLEEFTETMRKLVEDVQSRPRHDLDRIRALLEEARISQARARFNREAAWRQLAAEIGVTELDRPARPTDLPGDVPAWPADLVRERVLAASLEVRQATVAIDRARVQIQRAEAQVTPNVTVGAGYQNQYTNNQQGGVVSVILPLPVWDRRQGAIHEAESRLFQTSAAQKSLVNRLQRDTADALARYQGATEQATRLSHEVIPLLERSLAGVKQEFAAGQPRVTFADVLLATQNLNAARLRLADIRREQWRAIADLEGLMQLDVEEPLPLPPVLDSEPNEARPH